MERTDNYAVQVQQAKNRFLTYDQKSLIRKMRLEADQHYLYISMLSQRYRIGRGSGYLERLTDAGWISATGISPLFHLRMLLESSRRENGMCSFFSRSDMRVRSCLNQ